MSVTSVAPEAMYYASLGWRVIPIVANGKAPFLQEWEKAATTDESVIAGWFEQWPSANVGIVFGPDSGIGDVECDTEAAEKAFQELFDEGHDPTPFYKSKRGKHRFFKFSDKLPFQDQAVFKHKGIEFRTGANGKGAQSVAPPSTIDGVTREWILHPSECDVAEIPGYVIAKLANEAAGIKPGQFETKSPEEWQEIYSGSSEGDRNTKATQFIGKMLRLTTPLDQDYTWNQTVLWNLQNNPPLPEKELRTTFGSIFKAELERRAAAAEAEITETKKAAGQKRKDITEEQREAEREAKGRAKALKDELAAHELQEAVSTLVEENGGDPSDKSKGWNLKQIQDDPPRYELASPWWTGTLKNLKVEDLQSPRRLMAQAINQKGFHRDEGLFSALWKGKGQGAKFVPGIMSEVIARMERVAAVAGARKDIRAAEQILLILDSAIEKDEPQQNGGPAIIDGELWFQGPYLADRLQYVPDPPSPGLVSALLAAFGAESRQKKAHGKNRKYRVMSLEQLEAMREAVANEIPIL